MAATAEQVTVSPSPGAEVPAGELWRLVLRSWCGSTLAAVCERVGQFCDLDHNEIESTVLGLINDSITSLPPAVAEAFERALGTPTDAPTDRRNDDMARSPNGKAALTLEPQAPPVPPDPADEDLAPAPGEGNDDLRKTDSPLRRNWPFPCEEEGCERGFDTAQALRMHQRRRHAARPANGWPGKPAGKGDPLNDRHVKILSAAERPEDAETEAVAVCSRRLTKLTEPEAKRVLRYLAQRFVVDAS
jgi:hypothetical protein